MPRLIETLVAAFTDDPLYRWLYPDPTARADALWYTFGMLLAAGHESGAVHADSTGSAVAVWTPPGVALLDRGGEQALADGLRPRVGARVAREAAGTALHMGAPTPEPSWTLHCVAVHPSAQGLGLGAALLAPVLEGSDAAGIRVYLDSCNARNHSFFARLGFEAVVEAPVGVGGPTVHTMVRAAAARSVTATAHFRHESVWIEDPVGA